MKKLTEKKEPPPYHPLTAPYILISHLFFFFNFKSTCITLISCISSPAISHEHFYTFKAPGEHEGSSFLRERMRGMWIG